MLFYKSLRKKNTFSNQEYFIHYRLSIETEVRKRLREINSRELSAITPTIQ